MSECVEPRRQKVYTSKRSLELSLLCRCFPCLQERFVAFNRGRSITISKGGFTKRKLLNSYYYCYINFTTNKYVIYKWTFYTQSIPVPSTKKQTNQTKTKRLSRLGRKPSYDLSSTPPSSLSSSYFPSLVF